MEAIRKLVGAGIQTRIVGQIATVAGVALHGVECVGKQFVIHPVEKGDLYLIAQFGAQRGPGRDRVAFGEVRSFDGGIVDVPPLEVSQPDLLGDVRHRALDLAVEFHDRSQLAVLRCEPGRVGKRCASRNLGFGR